MANKEANEKLATSSDLDESGQMIYEVANEVLAETILTPVPLTAPDYLPLVNSEIDEALQGKKTPKEALDDAQKSVENLVSQNTK